MNNIYKHIQEIRKSRGMSQDVLAEHLGISQDAISKIERGITEITLNRLQQIADVFKMSVVEIINYPNGSAVGANDERVKELEKELLEISNTIKKLLEDSISKSDDLIKLYKEIALLNDFISHLQKTILKENRVALEFYQWYEQNKNQNLSNEQLINRIKQFINDWGVFTTGFE